MKQADRELAATAIQLMLSGTKLQTMKQIYGRLEPAADGRIRTKLAPYTDTGRLRSGEDDWWPENTTNLQNLPKKAAKYDELFQVRDCIIADPGHVLIAADLSQAELYGYLAWAGDAEKLDALRRGEDLHTAVAAATWDVAAEDVTYVQRQLGKFQNYSLGYGGGWSMFKGKVNKDADLTGIAVDAKTAKRAVAVWRQLNALTVKWWEDVKEQLRRYGYLTNSFGRRRVFLGKASSAGNDAIAYLPQSDIAEHLNRAMVRAFDKLDPHMVTVRLQVHDEVLVQVPEKSWKRAAGRLRQEMSKPFECNGTMLDIPVEVSVGHVWGQMEEVRV